jgi:DNA polymerase-3 subunit delta
MPATLAALDFLDKPKLGEAPICVVFGEDRFLKQEVLETVRRLAGADDQGEFSVSSLSGEVVELRDVLDAVRTRSLFGDGRRVVIVHQADDFVKLHRSALEDYAGKPSASGLLVLEVATWPKSTRLYKALDGGAGLQIECAPPTPARLAKWLRRRAETRHGATIDANAAQRLVDTLDPDAGLLDQELARLALLVASGEPITVEIVDANVGGWRTRTAWEMIDAALDGDAAEAIRQLDRLLLAGENPIGLFAQMASSLRRMAGAAQSIELGERTGRRTTISASLERAGVKKFILQKAERQLRQIGRPRARRLHRWLLEADLALKGASSSPPRARLVLETLIVRLAAARPASQRGAAPRRPARR